MICIRHSFWGVAPDDGGCRVWLPGSRRYDMVSYHSLRSIKYVLNNITYLSCRSRADDGDVLFLSTPA